MKASLWPAVLASATLILAAEADAQAGRVDAKATQADGSTALHAAARAGNEKLAASLIKAGADVNAANRYGVTPLLEAVVNPTGNVTALLLKAGANPDATFGRDGETVLMAAARSGNLPAATALIAAGADVNVREQRRGQTALMLAAGKGYAEIAGLIVKQGADVNAQDLPMERNLGRVVQAGGGRLPAGGMSALLFAARDGHRDAVRVLLDAGANPNQAEGDGWTPLLLAIANTHYTVAADLAARGADLALPNNQGLLPLYAAVEMRLPDITARPLRPERDAMTSIELIELLLEKGADPNGRLRAKQGAAAQITGAVGAAPVQVAGVGAGGNAFMRATRGGDLEVMRLLLQHGADPKATRDDGTNAIMIAGGVGAAGFGSTAQTRSPADLLAAIKLCEEAGLDINSLNMNGISALHGAAGSGNPLMIRVLVDAGAQIDLRNRDGMTPLEVAEGKGPPVRGRQPTPQPEAEAVLRELLGGKENAAVAENQGS